MAKTEEQALEALQQSIESTDPTIDTTQGPVPDLFMRPQAGQLAEASAEAENVRTLFTLQFSDSITEEETALALGNYASAPGPGRKARHIQYFMRFTRPTEDVLVPVGTLVSNSDASLTYRVLNSGTITVDGYNSFFNAAKGVYEIGLLVEATGVGPEYELPRFRIDTLLTPVLGIDTTENRVKSEGGLDAESIGSQTSRLKQSLQGINLGSPGGIRTKIRNSLSSEITDVAVVQPFEQEFVRLVDSAALDVYCIGSILTSFTQNVTAVGGQSQFVLDRVPAISITSVLINGVSGVVGYSLVPDTSKETGGSLSANDLLVLDTPLLSGDAVEIQYQYNSALEEVYDVVSPSGEEFLFNTSILIRSPFEIPPRIEGEIKILSSYDVSEIEEAITEFNATYFNFTQFTTTIYPERYRQDLINGISGVLSFRLTVFKRSIGALADLEPITFARNEISVLNADLVDIRVLK